MSTELVLRHVAAIDLVERSPLPGDPLDDRQFATLAASCAANRITGLLALAADSGKLPTTEKQREVAFEAAARAAAGDLRLEAVLTDVAAVLDEHGVEHRVLKGAAAAHLDAPDPVLRSFGDVDLLVRPSQYDDAVGLLQRAGFARRFPEPRPGFDARFGKGAAMHRDEHEVDLHRTLAPGPFGAWIALEDLWSSPQDVVVRGRLLRAPCRPVRFLHACYHAVLGGPTPRVAALRDAALIARSDAFDAARVAALARQWRGELVVHLAIDAVHEQLGVDLGDLVGMADARASRRERRALVAYRGDGPGRYARQAIATLQALPWRDRPAYVTALLAPRSDYVTDRHRGRGARLWHAATAATRKGRQQ